MSVVTRVWFAAWSCHCTWVGHAQADAPTRCPRHDAGLFGPVEPVVSDRAPVGPLGYESNEACGCPSHRPVTP